MKSGRGVLAVLLCGMWIIGTNSRVGAQAAPAAPAAASCGADLAKTLAGSWKAPQYKLKRGGDESTAVFGPNASDVRDVELTLDASGSGVLKITTSVLDQKGKTWAPTQVEAKIALGMVTTTSNNRCDVGGDGGECGGAVSRSDAVSGAARRRQGDDAGRSDWRASSMSGSRRPKGLGRSGRRYDARRRRRSRASCRSTPSGRAIPTARSARRHR